jgi:sugar phosphate isomerase/epimerase
VKLSASNIAWSLEDDQDVYLKLKTEGFSGLEIAPTRLIPEKPYQKEGVALAASIAAEIKAHWGFGICSMQSLWYGVTERIFGTTEERNFLIQYTCSALDFAAAVGCPHVVFGSPRNRIIDYPGQWHVGEEFFAACAAYAGEKKVVIGIEANPASYGTNYLNTTSEALELVKAVNSPFFKLNLDLGTMLTNQENLESVKSIIPYISHVHVSEPALAAVTDRPEHRHLARLLQDGNYRGWVSLEMRNSGKENLFRSLETMSSVFK